MTCIVGYIDKETDTVYIAGDSAGVAGLDVTLRKDPKVFETGPFIMGFTTSFRMGQLLMSSKFNPQRQVWGQSDYDYMITTFIDEVRAVFKEGGYEHGGSFLVGYRGQLYSIDSDFQVGEGYRNYDAVGCGEYYAKGAIEMVLQCSDEPKTEEEIENFLESVLSVVVEHNAGVRPPFSIVHMSKNESDNLILKQIK